MKKLLSLLLFALTLFSVLAIPHINSYVTDSSGMLSAETRSTLESHLKWLDEQYDVQFAIVIENEYDKQYSLEEYSLAIAEENKIGDKELDSGLLFYLAVDDKQFRWETGYGTEGMLNAALLGRISREEMIPYFQQGDYELGILQGVQALSKIIEKGEFAPSEKKSPSNRFFWIVLIIVLLIFLIVIYNSRKSRRTWTSDVYKGAGSGLFTGGFGRGGFGGSSGFGGFSGGGGSFGGGGFSGRFGALDYNISSEQQQLKTQKNWNFRRIGLSNGKD